MKAKISGFIYLIPPILFSSRLIIKLPGFPLLMTPSKNGTHSDVVVVSSPLRKESLSRFVFLEMRIEIWASTLSIKKRSYVAHSSKFNTQTPTTPTQLDHCPLTLGEAINRQCVPNIYAGSLTSEQTDHLQIQICVNPLTPLVQRLKTI